MNLADVECKYFDGWIRNFKALHGGFRKFYISGAFADIEAGNQYMEIENKNSDFDFSINIRRSKSR